MKRAHICDTMATANNLIWPIGFALPPFAFQAPKIFTENAERVTKVTAAAVAATVPVRGQGSVMRWAGFQQLHHT